ncbi:right-handed parallel beta-helix repeat-containing protein [Mariniflexile sp.]|uniref:right-handed parallel beta-helix repeat-containing protein n=1 Tax=Mariniflexile sp. TaxID=1979402 RepID=UPI00404744B9
MKKNVFLLLVLTSCLNFGQNLMVNGKIAIFFLLFQTSLFAKNYYVHPTNGKDTNSGLSKKMAFKTLERASKIGFVYGDRLLLASGQTYKNGLNLVDKHGTKNSPIIITTIPWESNDTIVPALIDFKGQPNGVLIEDCSYIDISHIQLTANGYHDNSNNKSKMRCGILISSKHAKKTNNIKLKNISIYDIFYENIGFKRGIDEVKTANGTQKYGWGIRVINNNANAIIEAITIENCHIKSVAHTGIKLTGRNKNISKIHITDNYVEATGGPGIQMSEVKNVTVTNNVVTHSGSNNDTRKWGRGSGLWTWGASNVLIEKNKFLYASGPADSTGAHIDFNCDNVVLQYNISAYNAGGFCEILGNNYNCAYRYNISINDGYRTKGENGAFQEGKILWLSGYQGSNKERKGPVNTYIYNNTIYCDASLVAKIAIDNTSNGIFIANNIFYINGGSKAVLGDQYKPDSINGELAKNVIFRNNLFLKDDNWPNEIGIKDSNPIFGNPSFMNEGGIEAKDYVPTNLNLIKNKGINISLLPNDSQGLIESLKLEKDILGNILDGKPSLGAIEP